MKTGNKECEECFLTGSIISRDYETGKIVEVKNPELEAAKKLEAEVKAKLNSNHGIRIIVLASTPDEKFQKYTFTYLGDIGWNGAMAEGLVLVNRMIKEQSWKPDTVIIEHIHLP